MKKILAFFILVTYFAFSCGVVVNFHYCMDELASTQLFVTDHKVCGNCGMHSDDSNGCCRDEVKVMKLQEDQQKTPTLEFAAKAPLSLIAFTPSFIEQPFENVDILRHHQNHSPPLLSEQDTYLQNGVFRI